MKPLTANLLTRPAITLALGLALLVGTCSLIYYVQRTLSEIEEALPITLSTQERDIRALVNKMGRLVQNIAFVRANRSEPGFSEVVRQTDEIILDLERVRDSYRFNDLIGVSTIHARLNPAIYDIKSWLSNGIHNFEPASAHTMGMVEQRAAHALQESETLLFQVGETALTVLNQEAQRINAFRNIMIVTLALLAVVTIGLVLLGFRLQKIVSALKQSEEQIRYRANYDSLTDLPNRLNFVEHLNEAIDRSKRSGNQTALLFIDLDRFKTINDTLGHDYGDELIRQVGQRIRDTIRKTDMVARLGGDEFTVLLSDMRDVIRASIIAKEIITRLSEPFLLHGHEIHTGASIGITVCPEDGDDAHTLLKNADMAMYEAKDKGRNRFRFFTPRMTEHAQKFLELDKDMRRALAQQEFELCFQPIFELNTPVLRGVEALLRWQHPEKGLIMPNDFVHVAEETGLIDEIGLWVLERACSDALPWLGHSMPPDFYLAVNVSMRQFKGGFGSGQLAAILDRTGFPPQHLQLEITESLLMDEDIRIKEALKDFRRMGIRLAVDDFGTGYSALSYLREFPVTSLKIDQSFVREIATNRSDRRLVEAIVLMAHGLGLVVVAEGVETPEQDTLLGLLGCDFAQGNFYSSPLFTADLFDLFGSATPLQPKSRHA